MPITRLSANISFNQTNNGFTDSFYLTISLGIIRCQSNQFNISLISKLDNLSTSKYGFLVCG